MTLKEILENAEGISEGSLLFNTSTGEFPEAGELGAGVVKLFTAPPECGWPKPEVYVDGMGKYAVWEALGLTPINPDELRAMIAMLGRALVEIES